ncbi:MAG: RNA polymerase sigma factor [Planctomycetota bacterium]|jgi:RNA polymerase sigma-70 factor (ECF subfamily)
MVDQQHATDVRRLTRAIAAGDAETFARFYEERFDRLYRHARAVTGRDEAFCLDVVQDAMMKVIRSMRPMDSEPELAAWLRRVVRSVAVDRIRADDRRRRREQGPRPDAADGLTGETFGGERRQWLVRELAGLEGSVATMLTQRFRFGWSLRRIAAAAGLSIGAVDGRINRAVSSLRRQAKERFDD